MSVTITVGIIARNEEKNIQNTLKNILDQSIDKSSYEIIVVDGNSSDKTREIASEVIDESAVKHKVINEADYGFHGHCFARNLVIDNSDPNSKFHCIYRCRL